MTTAFISHSSKDKHFADFLVKILEYHHIQCWYDSSNIELGQKFKEEIALGLLKSDFLIVLASENTKNSKWVAREISEFSAKKTDPRIIPIFLEAVDLNEIYDGLQEYQSIYLYQSMLDGFNQLFSFLNKEFLPVVDKREGPRRSGSDRRRASALARLRFGMWKNFETDARKGKFDVVEDSWRRIEDIVAVFMKPNSELSRYEFIDKTTQEPIILSRDDFTKVVYSVIERSRTSSSLKYIYCIEQIAEELSNIYVIKPKDRRVIQDRRKNK